MRPAIIVRLGPILPASHPAGSDASSVPAGYDALRIPAAVFDSPRSASYVGSSGAIAA